MSALAELIDREFLAARAPRPVTYDIGFGPKRPGTPNHASTMKVALNAWFAFWSEEPIALRMSDGSLVIVRRKR